MPSRNLAETRRAINRLYDAIQRDGQKHPPLEAIKQQVAGSRQLVEARFSDLRNAALAAKKEKGEGDAAIRIITNWHQSWRPVVMLTINGAASNLAVLPASGATPDDMIRAVRGLKELILENPAAASYRAAAIEQLGDALETATKEVDEARAATPAKFAARAAYTEAVLSANEVLVRGLDVVRAVYGPTSPQYKQFIGKRSPAEEAEDDEDSLLGEDE